MNDNYINSISNDEEKKEFHNNIQLRERVVERIASSMFKVNQTGQERSETVRNFIQILKDEQVKQLESYLDSLENEFILLNTEGRDFTDLLSRGLYFLSDEKIKKTINLNNELNDYLNEYNYINIERETFDPSHLEYDANKWCKIQINTTILQDKKKKKLEIAHEEFNRKVTRLQTELSSVLNKANEYRITESFNLRTKPSKNEIFFFDQRYAFVIGECKKQYNQFFNKTNYLKDNVNQDDFIRGRIIKIFLEQLLAYIQKEINGSRFRHYHKEFKENNTRYLPQYSLTILFAKALENAKKVLEKQINVNVYQINQFFSHFKTCMEPLPPEKPKFKKILSINFEDHYGNMIADFFTTNNPLLNQVDFKVQIKQNCFGVQMFIVNDFKRLLSQLKLNISIRSLINSNDQINKELTDDQNAQIYVYKLLASNDVAEFSKILCKNIYCLQKIDENIEEEKSSTNQCVKFSEHVNEQENFRYDRLKQSIAIMNEFISTWKKRKVLSQRTFQLFRYIVEYTGHSTETLKNTKIEQYWLQNILTIIFKIPECDTHNYKARYLLRAILKSKFKHDSHKNFDATIDEKSSSFYISREESRKIFINNPKAKGFEILKALYKPTDQFFADTINDLIKTCIKEEKPISESAFQWFRYLVAESNRAGKTLDGGDNHSEWLENALKIIFLIQPQPPGKNYENVRYLLGQLLAVSHNFEKTSISFDNTIYLTSNEQERLTSKTEYLLESCFKKFLTQFFPKMKIERLGVMKMRIRFNGEKKNFLLLIKTTDHLKTIQAVKALRKAMKSYDKNYNDNYYVTTKGIGIRITDAFFEAINEKKKKEENENRNSNGKNTHNLQKKKHDTVLNLNNDNNSKNQKSKDVILNKQSNDISYDSNDTDNKIIDAGGGILNNEILSCYKDQIAENRSFLEASVSNNIITGDGVLNGNVSALSNFSDEFARPGNLYNQQKQKQGQNNNEKKTNFIQNTPNDIDNINKPEQAQRLVTTVKFKGVYNSHLLGWKEEQPNKPKKTIHDNPSNQIHLSPKNNEHDTVLNLNNDNNSKNQKSKDVILNKQSNDISYDSNDTDNKIIDAGGGILNNEILSCYKDQIAENRSFLEASVSNNIITGDGVLNGNVSALSNFSDEFARPGNLYNQQKQKQGQNNNEKKTNFIQNTPNDIDNINKPEHTQRLVTLPQPKSLDNSYFSELEKDKPIISPSDTTIQDNLNNKNHLDNLHHEIKEIKKENDILDEHNNPFDTRDNENYTKLVNSINKWYKRLFEMLNILQVKTEPVKYKEKHPFLYDENDCEIANFEDLFDVISALLNDSIDDIEDNWFEKPLKAKNFYLNDDLVPTTEVIKFFNDFNFDNIKNCNIGDNNKQANFIPIIINNIDNINMPEQTQRLGTPSKAKGVYNPRLLEWKEEKSNKPEKTIHDNLSNQEKQHATDLNLNNENQDHHINKTKHTNNDFENKKSKSKCSFLNKQSNNICYNLKFNPEIKQDESNNRVNSNNDTQNKFNDAGISINSLDDEENEIKEEKDIIDKNGLGMDELSEILDQYSTSSFFFGKFLCCLSFIDYIRIRSPEIKALYELLQINRDQDKNKTFTKDEIRDEIEKCGNTSRLTLFQDNKQAAGINSTSTDKVIVQLRDAFKNKL